ncbi:hypothetical protein PVAND_000330 [Polypedilum vanderplanki]|uniref:F-box domain-containing protein n=1 Tax=Polypedilum vanderplanki TaxID=319348 RepID=A0A9J6BJN8_POLVA|nr:hypothetical protein PVAND_000330 [Polypedilum vanderplanki]
METLSNLWDLPNEILIKIFTKAKDNHKNLSLVCKRFYELITKINQDNLELTINPNNLFSPNFNFDQLLHQSSTITVNSLRNVDNIKNFDDKFTDFLKLHGNHITELNDVDSSLNFKKFLHLMPNLENLSSWLGYSVDNQNDFDEFEKNSIRLKKAFLYIHSTDINVLKPLQIFDIENIKILVLRSRMTQESFQKIVDFVSKLKNLCKYSGFYNEEMLEVLDQKKLESLEMCAVVTQVRKFEYFLKKQNQLKSLKVSNVTDDVFRIICNNLFNLNSLSLQFKEFPNNITFLQISNLSSLESLELLNIKPSSVSKIYEFILPNLESFKTDQYAQISVVCLAPTFPNLKSLNFFVLQKQYHESLLQCLEFFDKLVNLKIKTCTTHPLIEIPFDDKFYTDKHFNPNLKSLEIETSFYNTEKLLQKIKNDFPNLEKFPQFKYQKHEEFQKYREIIFNDVNRLLFFIDSNLNGIELLKDCSCEFNDRSVIKVIKDGRNKITFDLNEYFKYKQLQMMPNTPRILKSITISIEIEENKIAVDNFTKYLQMIGQNVIKLTLWNNMVLKGITLYQLQQIIEAFPNLETMTLENIYFHSTKEETIKIKNRKIKKISLIHTYFSHSADIADSFFNLVHFPENTLEYFKIKLRLKSIELFDRNFIEKFIEQQKMLTKFEENLMNSTRSYLFTYESYSEKEYKNFKTSLIGFP